MFSFLKKSKHRHAGDLIGLGFIININLLKVKFIRSRAVDLFLPALRKYYISTETSMFFSH